MTAKYWVIIPAAGSGQRMAGSVPKQYLPLAGKTVLEWSLTPFLARTEFHAIVVALATGDEQWARLPVSSDKRILTVTGGRERVDSVRAGLGVIAEHAKAEDWILVHDAARPCLHPDDLHQLIDALASDSIGGLLATAVPDTLKRAGPDGRVEFTVPRTHLWRALTPQMFRYGVLWQALEQCGAGGELITDEAAAVEGLGLKPLLVAGRSDNLKITVPEDLAIAERHLAARR